MMRFLDAKPDSRHEWLDWWQRTGSEPFAHPDYVSLLAETHDQVMALTWSDPAGGQALLPLIRRPIPTDLHLQSEAASLPWTDIVSPYGYGGPFTSGTVDSSALFGALLGWMRDERVVTAFIRPSPTHVPPAGLELEGYETRHVGDIVIVGLGRSRDDQWRHYEHKVRKNVNKASRAGMRVEILHDFIHLDEFVEIYTETMGRRGASSWYFFGRPLFERLGETLSGNYVLAEVYEPSGRIVSVELVLVSDRFLYSFLGGTRRDAFRHAPNDLLKHAVIDYGRDLGKEGYVLGGGYLPDDGVFRYKRAFDVGGIQPFTVVQLTAEQRVRRTLDRARLAQARREHPDAELPPDFFPPYRAPLAPPSADHGAETRAAKEDG